MLPKPVAAATELAHGRRARVVAPDGGVHHVLGEAEQSPQDALDMAERVAQLDQQVRVTLSMAAGVVTQMEQMAARLEAVLELVEKASEGQREFSAELKELNATLKMPIVPIYRKDGMLRAGVRMAKLPEDK